MTDKNGLPATFSIAILPGNTMEIFFHPRKLSNLKQTVESLEHRNVGSDEEIIGLLRTINTRIGALEDQMTEKAEKDAKEKIPKKLSVSCIE